MEGFLRGIGTAGMGLRLGLMYKLASIKSAEKWRQERWRFDAFLHTLNILSRISQPCHESAAHSRHPRCREWAGTDMLTFCYSYCYIPFCDWGQKGYTWGLPRPLLYLDAKLVSGGDQQSVLYSNKVLLPPATTCRIRNLTIATASRRQAASMATRFEIAYRRRPAIANLAVHLRHTAITTLGDVLP